MDITYIPMARGFVYLAAVLDWFSSRAVVARIDRDGGGIREALEDVLGRHGGPEIFNTVQGSRGRLVGQCVRRAALAQPQIRGGVSAGLRRRQRRPRFDRPLPGLL